MTVVLQFLSAIWATIIDPSQMAQRIMARRYTRGTLWMGLALVSILSVLLLKMLYFIAPVAMPLGFTPNLYGLVMACVLVILTFGLYLTGQTLGGKATFPHSFAIIIWLEAVALVIRTAQALVYLATAPKSTAVYKAFGQAQKAAKKTGSLMPPKHILNAPTMLMAKEGYSEGYIYDPDTPESF